MKHLFIYNLIPDELRFYVLPADHPIIPHLEILHDLVENVDDFTDEQNASAEFLYSQEGSAGTGNELKQFKVDASDINKEQYAKIHVYGFYL